MLFKTRANLVTLQEGSRERWLYDSGIYIFIYFHVSYDIVGRSQHVCACAQEGVQVILAIPGHYSGSTARSSQENFPIGEECRLLVFCSLRYTPSRCTYYGLAVGQNLFLYINNERHRATLVSVSRQSISLLTSYCAVFLAQCHSKCMNNTVLWNKENSSMAVQTTDSRHISYSTLSLWCNFER